jgi:hypothetical protein
LDSVGHKKDPVGTDSGLQRAFEKAGARARGYNIHSIGIACEDGLNARGFPADTRTPE